MTPLFSWTRTPVNIGSMAVLIGVLRSANAAQDFTLLSKVIALESEVI